jgi:CpeT protein
MINCALLFNHPLIFTLRVKNYGHQNLTMSTNMNRFSEHLTGDWNNKRQSSEFPALWSHIHVCYQPLPVKIFGSPSFYVESAYDYSLDKPYKTAIVTLEEIDHKIEMKNFKIKHPEKFWFGAHDPSLLIDLKKDDTFKLPEICDTIFEYIDSKKIYEGRTRPGKKCLIMRGNIKTYLDSRIIVSPSTYSSWDIGRDIENDNQVWGATSGPFCFEKTIFNK